MRLLFTLALCSCAPLVVPPFMGSPSSGSPPKLGAYQGLQFSGDINGNYVSQTNVGLQGRSVASTAPTSGQALEWSGSAWAPTTIAIGPSTFTPGTADQLLDTNHGATTAEWFTLGGDASFASHNLSLNSITPTGGTSTIVPFNAGGMKLATTPWVLQDSGAVQRVSIETAHGRGTFGGGGSDTACTLGPLVGGETAYSAIYCLPHGTSPTGTNYLALGDSSNNTYLNAWGSGGNILFLSGGSQTGQLSSSAFVVGWSAATATIQSGTTATSLGVGTNKAGAGLLLNVDANAGLFGLYGGTQDAIALGAHLATSGHIQTPSGWEWMSRNSGNTANNRVMYDDGSNNFTFGTSSGGSGYANVTFNGNTFGTTSYANATFNAATSLIFDVNSSQEGQWTSSLLTISGTPMKLSAQYEDVSVMTAPAAPASGSQRIYTDAADNKIKVVDSSGNVFTLAP